MVSEMLRRRRVDILDKGCIICCCQAGGKEREENHGCGEGGHAEVWCDRGGY